MRYRVCEEAMKLHSIIFVLVCVFVTGACSKKSSNNGGSEPFLPPLTQGSGQRCPEISGSFSCTGHHSNLEGEITNQRNFEVKDTADGQVMDLYGQPFKLNGQIHEAAINGVKVRYSANCTANSLELRASGDNGEEQYLKLTVTGLKTLHEEGRGLEKGKTLTTSANCSKK